MREESERRKINGTSPRKREVRSKEEEPPPKKVFEEQRYGVPPRGRGVTGVEFNEAGLNEEERKEKANAVDRFAFYFRPTFAHAIQHASIFSSIPSETPSFLSS